MSLLGWWLAPEQEIDNRVDERLKQQIGPKFQELWDYVLKQTDTITELGERMTNVEQQAWDQLGALIGVVIAEVKSLRDGIAEKDAALAAAQAALANADADAARKVQEALDTDSASDAARVNSYLDQLKTAVPADVPEVEVPDAGQPAEPPAGSGVDVPPVEQQ